MHVVLADPHATPRVYRYQWLCLMLRLWTCTVQGKDLFAVYTCIHAGMEGVL